MRKNSILTEEHKRKISESRKGIPRGRPSDETIEKIRASNKGKN